MKKVCSNFNLLLRAAQIKRTSIILLIVLLPASGCSLSQTEHPSDGQMISNFFTHETEFDTLVKMVSEDQQVSRIAYDFTWLKDNLSWPRPESELGFTKERWDQYRLLFRKLGLAAGILKNSNGSIFFLASTKGLSISGSMKGYVHSDENLEPQVSSLDNISGKIKEREIPADTPIYRKIKDNWYVYYQGN